MHLAARSAGISSPLSPILTAVAAFANASAILVTGAAVAVGSALGITADSRTPT